MSNPHCGVGGCVLHPGHAANGSVHRDGLGQPVRPAGPDYTEGVRQRCLVVASGLKDENARSLIAVAAHADPYITFAVIQTLNRNIAEVGSDYVRAALRNHGLNL